MIDLLKRTKKTIYGNGGFSLAELLVAFALLAMLMFTTVMLMSAGSNMFTVTNKLMSLQYKSQTAMAQFQQYFMSADGGMMKDGNIFYIAERGDIDSIETFDDRLAKGTLHCIVYDEGEQKLYLVNAGAKEVKDAGYKIDGFDRQPLCSGVASIDVVPSSEPGTSNYSRKAFAVTVNLVLAQQGKSYTAKQNFTLRNKPSLIIGVNADGGDASRLETLVKDVWDT